jgi:hypothetical protein
MVRITPWILVLKISQNGENFHNARTLKNFHNARPPPAKKQLGR